MNLSPWGLEIVVMNDRIEPAPQFGQRLEARPKKASLKTALLHASRRQRNPG
jgi:hypothetical protein